MAGLAAAIHDEPAGSGAAAAAQPRTSLRRLATVGIVGRPNVGKSTLFNRLVGRRAAVVAPEPGVTRDRKAAHASWQGHSFEVVDTGGWSDDGDALDDKVSRQSERAMADADVVLFVVDITVGVTEADARIASRLRRSSRCVLVVANKADHTARDVDMWEFAALGLGTPWSASALHGRNVGDLLDRIVELLPDAPQPDALLPDAPQPSRAGKGRVASSSAAAASDPESDASPDSAGHADAAPDRLRHAADVPDDVFDAGPGDAPGDALTSIRVPGVHASDGPVPDSAGDADAAPDRLRHAADVPDEVFDADSGDAPDSARAPGVHDLDVQAPGVQAPDAPVSGSTPFPGSATVQDAPASAEQRADDAVPSVAIVGRPNVGKSTLFNRLIGDERSIVHDRPGTTRDAIDTLVVTEAGPLRFVDTAGMRRKARVDSDTEYYANLRALRAIDACDVTLLVIDAAEGVTAQDQRLAERIDAAGCPIVVLLNKWETLAAEQRSDLLGELARRLSFVGQAPVLRISALTGRGTHRLVPAIDAAMQAYVSRTPTRKVNETIQRAQSAQPAPGGARVLYATQGAASPPTFTLFANRTLPATYLRYLERCLRTELGLGKTPVKLRVRRR